MGLIKRNGYEVKGVNLPQAYAKINRLYMENGNHARVYFGISSDRENLNNGLSLEEKEYECLVDKNDKIYEQIYTQSKLDIFDGWEDDIVVEAPLVEGETESQESTIENESTNEVAKEEITEELAQNEEATINNGW